LLTNLWWCCSCWLDHQASVKFEFAAESPGTRRGGGSIFVASFTHWICRFKLLF
jgi:hypothetical protein